MRHLRVGIDAWGLGSGEAWSGMGQYAAALLRWVPTFTPVQMVAYGAPGEARPAWLSPGVRWRVPGRSASGRLAAIVSRLRWLPGAVAEDGIDVFHAPGVHVRPSSPPVPSVGCPLVVTIHDVIPLSHYRSVLPARNRAFYTWNLRRAVTADRALTVSASARNDIARLARLPPSRTTVVTSAVDFPPNRDRSALVTRGIDGDYLLYAGSYEPRKDLVGMLHAFDRYRAGGGRHSLVAITEPRSGHAAAVQATLSSLPCRPAVRLVHSVPDEALRSLYTHATAVIFPSLAEGLGLPAIQAAACGVPVVGSDIPALRETVGEFAVLARPGDPASLSETLVRVTTDPTLRAVAATIGPRIAARYSPAACASDHAQVYESCREHRYALA